MNAVALKPGPQPRTQLVNSKARWRDYKPWGGAADHALRHMLADLPDPVACAQWLPLEVVEALDRAHATKGHRYAASEPDAAILRRHGLCEYGGRALTNYGIAVRRVIAG